MVYRPCWRKVCVFAWLLCHDGFVYGLQVNPLLSSSFNSSQDTIESLMQRASLRPNASCPVKGYNACSNGTPDYFCCPSDTTCVIAAAGTTALCCPKGASCDVITTIICDVAAQDVVKNPDSPIHTTKLDESLPVCGQKCCPFGYKCRGGSACVMDEGESRTSSSSSSTPKIIATGTRPFVIATATTTSTSVVGLPASTTTSTSTIRESSTPATSQTPPPAVTSSETSTTTPGSVIAGTTVAAVASVAGLTCLLWFKRRSISEKVGRPWQQLRGDGGHHSDQDVSLPRYSSPPPAYKNAETKPPLPQRHTFFKHYSPESVGSNPPVELPATPVSFSAWNPRSPRMEGRAAKVRSHFEPYRRPG
ncbi:GPI transamidase component pig-S/T [Colletotrichum musicola]|uniref:GPI transamidase component pig-S/T n=1 Tax=Colletotrichum musicola TaxID=2175873 RepID=A0A8H6N7Y1_9PEZI|nr:GPI transamidase component pig-S/T [Colletotrichum musicola]